MKKPHYGWLVAIAAMIVLFCAAGLTVGSLIVYLPYLKDSYELSPVDTSRLITIRNVAKFISLFAVSWLTRRIGIRNTVLFGMLCATAMFAICAFAKSYYALLMAMVFGGLAHCFGGMVPISTLLNRWFVTNKGKALGIATSGTGMALLITPALITAVIESMGLKAAFIGEMMLIVLCTALSFVIIRNSPEDKGLTPINEAVDKCKEEQTTILRKHPRYAGDKITERIFLLWIVLMGTSIYGTTQHWTLLYNEFDFSPINISLLISFSGIVVTVGKVTYGLVSDGIGAKRTGWLFMGLSIIGSILACLAMLQSMPVALLATFFVFIGAPLGTVGISMFAAELFKPNEYIRVVQRFNISYAIGSILGTEVTGYVTQITGSYVPAYIVHTVLMTIALLICIGAYLRIMKRATIPEVLIDEEESWRVAQ